MRSFRDGFGALFDRHVKRLPEDALRCTAVAAVAQTAGEDIADARGRGRDTAPKPFVGTLQHSPDTL